MDLWDQEEQSRKMSEDITKRERTHEHCYKCKRVVPRDTHECRPEEEYCYRCKEWCSKYMPHHCKGE